MATIADVVTNLENVGIFEFFLPFILLFAVFYGMMMKTKIFGDHKADTHVVKINAIVSFCAAAFIMLYPTTHAAVFELTDYLANFIGGTLIYVLAIIVFMIVMFMIATPLKGGEAPKFEKAGLIGAVVAVVLVVALFLSSGGTQIFPGININLGTGAPFLGGLGGGYIDPSMMALVLVLAVMGGAVWWMLKDSK